MRCTFCSKFTLGVAHPGSVKAFGYYVHSRACGKCWRSIMPTGSPEPIGILRWLFQTIWIKKLLRVD